MNKTILILGIIFLLIGAGVVSSTEHIVDDNHSNYHPMESNIESKEILSRSDIAYGYISDSGSSGHPEGPCYFYLDDPGNIYSLAPTESTYFLNRGTWTSEEIWYGCEYATGSLWTINPNNGDMTNIGNGGLSCFGLSCYPAYNKLYGVGKLATSIYLIEYDQETGEQYIICTIEPPFDIMGIAFDGNGTLYAWDLDYLFIIEGCKATLVGPLDIYAGDGHFDYNTDILYLSTFFPTSRLYECDKETGSCTLIGNFEGGAEITCLAIPYYNDTTPPVTTITLDPPEPNGCNGWYVSDVNVTLNATDDISGVKTIYYKIPGDDWKSHSGDSIKILLDYDCLTGLFEFYSVDNAGNQEEIKSVDIDIDQLPPYIQLSYEVKDGNPIEGWPIVVTADVTDNCSDMDYVEFYLNDVLQEVVTGPGPTYSWSFRYYPEMKIITIGVNCCDIACNCEYYEMPFKSSRNSIQLLMHPLFLRLLERFTLLERLYYLFRM